MSLARAFTKRIKRENENQQAHRSNTVRYAAGSIRRDMISLPTELISTTNLQALNAPDISSLKKSSSGSSLGSQVDSDFATIDRSFLTDHDRTDASSVESSTPATPVTPPLNSSLGFFDAKTPLTAPKIFSDGVSDIPAVPQLPQRSPSHSKEAHVELSRKRSQRMSPPPNNIVDKPARSSLDIFGGSDDAHPFGKELAKVNEVAEEFGATATVMDEEEREIISKGFRKFTVEDYINEIAGLYGGVYDGKLGPVSNPWI